ncbi:hypothetical protein MKX50_23865 [Paenibacillus sp. FSL W8-0186]|uniref:Cellobiose phosphorylase n=1 Tax=Paenibacillus woosongensis TaxID=307580 RepID=A0ABQ4MS60_9BACL|nr:hypothetical protein [Paenibacillus woosongensis]GIP58837.1 hypothetical protein J15TS10_26510 [Paenibacillus woosongensis]
MVEAYYTCLHCKDKRVRILTIDGRQYTGTITNVDYQNVYLRPDGRGVVRTSAFRPGFYGNQILTLSLFTLLAIALI